MSHGVVFIYNRLHPLTGHSKKFIARFRREIGLFSKPHTLPRVILNLAFRGHGYASHTFCLRCVAAKDWLSAQLGTEAVKMNKILADKVSIGDVGDVVAIRFSADSKPK